MPTDEIAVAILKTSPQLWMRLQADWDLQQALQRERKKALNIGVDRAGNSGQGTTAGLAFAATSVF